MNATRLRKLIHLLSVVLIVAVALSLGIHGSEATKVQRGFAFGPPVLQQTMQQEGVYVVRRWGYPSTYRETQSFRSTTGTYYDTSYESKPFSIRLAVSNVVFWMALVAALLAPITILWRPKPKPKPKSSLDPEPSGKEPAGSRAKVTESAGSSQAKNP